MSSLAKETTCEDEVKSRFLGTHGRGPGKLEREVLSGAFEEEKKDEGEALLPRKK